jgi:hypothetical protein
MEEKIKHINPAAKLNDVYRPYFFHLSETDDRKAFQDLTADNCVSVYDDITAQLRELIKSNNPSIKIKPEEYPALIEKHLNGRDIKEYGVWVYYPWNKNLVHILDEEEFVDIRTNRNRYKITSEEQLLLRSKKIGIIGLSVGQSIALTLAMERTCGEIRLADFDTAELSNLNRIRTGLHNLGLKKTVIAAREISEIDPFLMVRTYEEGLNKDNIDAFFKEHGSLDLLVEVCDGLDIKILSRFKARELKVPVVMDTNDRGMLDVERFDLEPGRAILHGLAGDLDPQKITNLTNEEKIPYILKMIGAETISTRLKASMLEVEQSINTWPQLASSVALGGAITTDVCRRILLDQYHDSGRYYIDVEDLIKDKPKAFTKTENKLPAGLKELKIADFQQIVKKYTPALSAQTVDQDRLREIIEAACLAPSGGNSQPWKFLFQDNYLYIFHDPYFSYSLLDFNNLGSYISFGAMLENIEIKSASLGLSVKEDIFPLKEDLRLIAAICFENTNPSNRYIHLAPLIGERLTNRTVSERKLLNEEDKSAFKAIASSIPGANLQLFDDEQTLHEFAEILTNTERIRFLHPQGHYDTFVTELRFSQEEVEKSRDGMDIQTLNVSQSDIAALRIAKDPAAVAFLHKLEKGSGFKKITRKNVLAASSIGVITMNGRDAVHFLEGGRSLERIWLEANHRKISLQPISQIIFMTELLMTRGKTYFNSYEQQELAAINKKLEKIINVDDSRAPVFVFRLCYADAPKTRSLRKSIDQVFFLNEKKG